MFTYKHSSFNSLEWDIRSEISPNLDNLAEENGRVELFEFVHYSPFPATVFGE